VGYGPARAFSAAAVAKSLRDLLIVGRGSPRRYDGARMDELEIYPTDTGLS